jgi:hypothetical protein
MLQQSKSADEATGSAAELREQIARVENLVPQLPDRAAALYLLSTLKQQAGETGQALKLLRQCLAFNQGFDPAGSPSLSKLKGSKVFDDLVQRVHREFPVVARARLAFVTKEKDLVPEGLAYDARQDVFYLSSLNRRKIVRINFKDAATDFVPSRRDHLLPVLGIRVNPCRWHRVGCVVERRHWQLRAPAFRCVGQIVRPVRSERLRIAWVQ